MEDFLTMKRKHQCRVYGNFIVENNATIRGAAQEFGVAKTTVYNHVTKTLPKVDEELAEKVRKVLDQNKAERHIRGGMANRAKYRK